MPNPGPSDGSGGGRRSFIVTCYWLLLAAAAMGLLVVVKGQTKSERTSDGVWKCRSCAWLLCCAVWVCLKERQCGVAWLFLDSHQKNALTSPLTPPPPAENNDNSVGERRGEQQ